MPGKFTGGSPARRTKVSLRQSRRANTRVVAELGGAAASPAGRQADRIAGLVGFYGDQQTVVRLAGFSLRSLANYKAGSRLIRGAAERRLSELERLKDGLAAIMKPEAVAGWLQRPNAVFDGLKPLEVIERGNTDQIWRMIYLAESGSPS